MKEFILGQGPGHKLETAIGRNDGDATHVEWLSSGTNFNSVILLATGQAELVMKLKPAPEVLDPIVSVDRTAELVYPDYLKVLYPELRNIGPAEYDGTKLGQFLSPDQMKRRVTGDQIHEHLKSNNMLESCLGLEDLNAIQKKGIAFFRANFKHKAVFGWRSIVVQLGVGYLRVPCLCEHGGGVVLSWVWLGDNFSLHDPALHFAS
jgi:hypothetical protein